MKSTLTRTLVALVAGTMMLGATADTVRTGFRPKLHFPGSPPRPLPGVPAQFGLPLPDLTAAQLAAFEEGREEFENEETAAGGLGPGFNHVSCAGCHLSGATGGAGVINETRFGRLVDGRFDPMTEQGGSLLQDKAIDPAAQEVIPADATIIALRQTTPLFGLGLMEAIPEIEIRLNALRRKPDGVTGRVAMVLDVVSGRMKVGRFGWKNQQATVLAFAGDAYLNEMGITSRFFPTENAPNGNAALLARFDNFADPEDQPDPVSGKGDIDKSAEFTRLLAPPPPLRLSAAGVAGKRVFEQTGCEACHTPVMFTGPSDVRALSFKPVPLYSDLLLHDMGSLGDGIAQGDASRFEMRTAPLWGLRASAPYLHDGRAATVDEAIRAHAGEGARARDRYVRLNARERQQLLEFLNSI